MLDGIITKGIGGFYYVKTSQGMIECKARGKFRNEKIVPVVGDKVEISLLEKENNQGRIEKIKNRKNELIRPSVANVDQAIIVFAVKFPDPNLGLLDRFLILTQSQGLHTIIIFNKTDLVSEKESEILKSIYEKAGYPTLLLSTYNSEGIDQLEYLLKDQISVFAGPSGVGKSSIANKIQPNLLLKTGDVSEKIERGKHTTRHVELLKLEIGGFVLDTPGFTSLDVAVMNDIQVEKCYPEFIRYENECKYNGCKHVNEPNCAVKYAVEKGWIDKERYKRYVGIYEEIKEVRRW